MIPITKCDRILSNRVWAHGVKAIKNNRATALLVECGESSIPPSSRRVGAIYEDADGSYR